MSVGAMEPLGDVREVDVKECEDEERSGRDGHAGERVGEGPCVGITLGTLPVEEGARNSWWTTDAPSSSPRKADGVTKGGDPRREQRRSPAIAAPQVGGNPDTPPADPRRSTHTDRIRLNYGLRDGVGVQDGNHPADATHEVDVAFVRIPLSFGEQRPSCRTTMASPSRLGARDELRRLLVAAGFGVEGELAVARTMRTRLIGLPGRLVNRAGRPTLRLPERWPWADTFITALDSLRLLRPVPI